MVDAPKYRLRRFGFVDYVFVSFIISVLFVFFMFFLIKHTVYFYNIFPYIFYLDSARASEFLSTIVKVQATIFGIFFSINFLVLQSFIPNLYISPIYITKYFISTPLIFVTFVNISSFIFIILLIFFSSTTSINILIPMIYSLFSIILIFPYMHYAAQEMLKAKIVTDSKDKSLRFYLNGLELDNEDLTGNKLSNKLLNGSSFYNSRLDATDFSDSELMFSKFINSYGTEPKFDGSNLSNSIFRGGEYKKAHFKRAILNWVNFYGVNLEESDFTGGTSLNYANFQNSKLNSAKFESAFLVSADLSGADLRGTDLSFITYNETTLSSLLRANVDNTTIMDDKLKKEYDESKQKITKNAKDRSIS